MPPVPFLLDLSCGVLYYIFMQALLNAPNQAVTTDILSREDVLKIVKSEKKSFSILDVLVILSALLVVAFLGYLYLNPDKKGADVRNIHRSADVSSLLTSISAYSLKVGDIPEVIPISKECISAGHEICKVGPYDCTGLVNLSFLADTEAEAKIFSIPSDPSSKSVNGTGYYISQDGKGNITICSPYSERNVEVSFTRAVF